jgi:hypothetical protein
VLRWVRCAAVLLLPGCFHPVYEHLACGAGKSCPSGLACNRMSNLCEPPGIVVSAVVLLETLAPAWR